MVRERGGAGGSAGAVSAAARPAEAPLPAADVGALLRANAADPDRADRPALRFGDRVWTHRDLLDEADRFARLFRSRLDPDRPPHVAVLLDNTPDYVFALCGAGLAGACVVGLNTTRRDGHLARDVSFTDTQLLVTEPRHLPLLEPVLRDLDLPGGLLLSGRFTDGDDPVTSGRDSLEDALDAVAGPALEEAAVDVETLWILLFTSGTSAAPKAVRVTQRRLLSTGNRMSDVLGIGPEDTGYVAMPLFHSNALMVGLAPALVAGASVGLARRFSASRFLDDVRRYRATWFNYTGKPLAYLLATPARPDDAENSLVLAYGNEGSPHVVEAVAERFGITVVDVFGSTEGAIALDRTGQPPRGSIGRLRPDIKIVDPDGNEVERARPDPAGNLVVTEACVGEIVCTSGPGPFEGYYRNDEAMARTTRGGWYWSGDLGYVDGEGWVFFAGRTSDWLRVDGENFPAAPVEAVLARHPDVVLAAAYGVPDVDSGDQVMAALVLTKGSRFDPAGFAAWVDDQATMSPKWRPRYVRICPALPSTPTNKVLTRTLVHQKFRSDRTGGDPLWIRDRGRDRYEPFGPTEEDDLHDGFEAAGRQASWDL